MRIKLDNNNEILIDAIEATIKILDEVVEHNKRIILTLKGEKHEHPQS